MLKGIQEWGALGTTVLALLLQGTPEEFMQGFQQWRWLFGTVAALGAGYFLYRIGYRRGAEGQLGKMPAANSAYLSPSRLKYYIRQLRDLLLERGAARRDTITQTRATLEKVNPLWDDESTYNARKKFLDVAAEAAEVRRGNGNRFNGIWGDFKEDERASFEIRLNETAEALITSIR